MVNTLVLAPLTIAATAGQQLGGLLRRACSWLGELSSPLYIVHYPLFQLTYEMSRLRSVDPRLQVLSVGTLAIGIAWALARADRALPVRYAFVPSRALSGQAGLEFKVVTACLGVCFPVPIRFTRPRNPPMTTPIPATLIPGDGIGPEIVDATLAALDALKAPFEWDRQIAGLGGVQSSGDPLPAATLDSIRRTRLALKGPLETPSGGGYRSSNVRLREEFELYANVRPARTIVPGGRFDKIDLVVVRENLEGLYIGHEHYVEIDGDPHAVAMATGINTRQGSRRLLEYAFETAVATGRRKVTIVHKANIMKALTGIFLETGLDLYERKYKGKFELDTVIIDACAMKLVLNPWQFDMLVTTNLFGDILSDLAAGLVGGLGMAPGANIGLDAAIFEAVHGSAPDIAGKGIANPTALLLAAALMLDHVKLPELATRLRKASTTRSTSTRCARETSAAPPPPPLSRRRW